MGRELNSGGKYGHILGVGLVYARIVGTHTRM